MFPGPKPLCFVYQSDAFSRMCTNYKDNVSKYRDLSKLITLEEKQIFPLLTFTALFYAPLGESLSFS